MKLDTLLLNGPGRIVRALLRATIRRGTVICLRVLRLHYLPVLVGRIGHLAFEVDAFVKEGELTLRPPLKGILCAPPGGTSNSHLAAYWRRYVHVVTSPLLCRCIRLVDGSPAVTYNVTSYGSARNASARYAFIQRAWGDRPALLQLHEEDLRRGRDCLRELGVPEAAWFVCVHSREVGYAPWDDDANGYRNSDIADYIPAMQAVVERGGWCIRMGTPSMKPIPALEGVIDYANSPFKSEWMDVFLCGKCRFFLGNSSGLGSVPPLFGVPTALANLAPIGVLPFSLGCIGIPKLLWSVKLGRYMTFKEAFASPVSRYWLMDQEALFEQEGVRAEDNSAEDIRSLCLEMLDRLDGRWTSLEGDEDLQCRYRSLMKPDHYSFGVPGLVGTAFLRKYADWL